MIPHREPRNRWALAAAWLGLGVSAAVADEPPPTLAIGPPGVEAKASAPPSRRIRTSPKSESGGWWVGTAGIALALAAFGGVSLATRRWMPGGGDPGSLRVLGRVHLSSKHSACLLRVGDRVLLVGLGPGGPPALLDEIADPDSLRLAPAARPAPVVITPRVGGAA